MKKEMQQAIKNMSNEELPMCACGVCATCGKTLWRYKGKTACGDRDCEEFGMEEAMNLFKDKLKDSGKRLYQEIDQTVAKEIWREWEKPYVWDEKTIEWFNSRPKIILDLIMKFPPDAQVKAKRPLDCPKPWEVGTIASYFENGNISVVVPGREIRAQCEPGWLKVIAFRPGLSPDDIKKHLKKAP